MARGALHLATAAWQTRVRGRVGGRPKGLSKKAQDKAMIAATLYNQGRPVREISEHLRISKSTLYRYLNCQGIKPGNYVPTTIEVAQEIKK